MRLVVVRLVVALLISAWAAPGWGYPVYRRVAQEVYGKAVACEMCHERGGGTELNSYGLSWMEEDERAGTFKKIEAGDSDEDGVNNGVEIEKGSNPGNARSTPQRPGRYGRRASRIAIPLDQLKLVLPAVARFEAQEVTLGDGQVEKVGAVLERALTFEERHPTLFYALDQTRRGAVAAFTQFETRAGWYSLLVGVSAAGAVVEVALFRAGGDTGVRYRPYLECLEGKRAEALPAAGSGKCPRVAKRPKAAAGIHEAVRVLLVTLDVIRAKP